ncbi:MAG: alpha/beta fold hydrolase, partial [Acidimicrobiales bacterium]
MTKYAGGLHVVDHAGPDQRAATPVVLVHGSLDRATSFARVVRRLPELHVVTYDRRAYYRSRAATPVPTTLAGHVADLLDLVGEGPAMVVGHSFGGDVALGAALQAPDAVIAVGAYEPPMPWLDWWPRSQNGGVTSEDPSQFAEAFFRRMVGDAGWEGLSDRARAERRADGPALLAELTALRGGGPPFDISALAVPAVFARGEKSVWHHRRAIDTLSSLVPAAEVVEVAGAAHGAHLS